MTSNKINPLPMLALLSLFTFSWAPPSTTAAQAEPTLTDASLADFRGVLRALRQQADEGLDQLQELLATGVARDSEPWVEVVVEAARLRQEAMELAEQLWVSPSSLPTDLESRMFLLLDQTYNLELGLSKGLSPPSPTGESKKRSWSHSWPGHRHRNWRTPAKRLRHRLSQW